VAAGAGFGLLALAALTALAACSQGGETVRASTTAVTEADNRHAVTIAVGDTLVVSLKTTPGTGFSWKISQIDDKVLHQQGEPQLLKAANPIPGAPATQVFRFVAASGGSTDLELDYVRPWEKSAPPQRTFYLGVTVR
jgi:inhibitor of cysteine peptidase